MHVENNGHFIASNRLGMEFGPGPGIYKFGRSPIRKSLNLADPVRQTSRLKKVFAYTCH